MRSTMQKLIAVLLSVLMLAVPATVSIQALEPSGNGVKIRNWVTNDPNYTFSEAYMTSVWYQNFHSLSLTENQRNNVLRIAVSQLGYHEGNSPEEFSGTNRSGSGNYIEYARLIVPNYNNNSYEWCACFVNWVLNQARIDYCYGEIGCWKWVEWLKANDMFEDSAAYKGSYDPQPADMIFFNWNATNTTSGHIGYVLYTTEDKVYTIEGNSNNEVGIRSYALNDPCIIGYGTPPYEEGSEATLDYAYANGMPRGAYVITSAMARITTEADNTTRLTTTVLGSTVKLLELVETEKKGTRAKVLVSVDGVETVGYMEPQYLCLMTPMNTLSFVADDQLVEEVLFTVGDENPSTVPAVPEKEGYTGAWENYTLGTATGDITVKAVYTALSYTVTFQADGVTVDTRTYTTDAPTVTPPAVPEKEGYTGAWEPFTLTTGDVVVNAVYTEIPPETQPETTAPTAEDTVLGETEISGETETEKATSSGGCSTVLGLTSPALLLLPALTLLRKKRRDE